MARIVKMVKNIFSLFLLTIFLTEINLTFGVSTRKQLESKNEKFTDRLPNFSIQNSESDKDDKD